jgi:hypothetical protein
MGSPLIFISHAAIDREIALSIKSWLGQSSPMAEIFVSSDPEDLPLGDSWVETILVALKGAALVLALTTERGPSRRWVWFESGRTWFSGVPCIPCCLGKVRKSELPAPFHTLSSVNLDEIADVRRLMSECARKVGVLPAEVNIQAMVEELVRLDIRAEERQRAIEDPFSSELTQDVERVMRGFDSGTKEALRLLLKHGELTEQTAKGLVMQSGKLTNQSMFYFGLENRTG